MSKFLRNRWLHRVLVASALTALGVGIYRIQSPAPMCTIDASNRHPYCFADEGWRLITRSGPDVELGMLDDFHRADFQGPLKIWDTRTGEELACHLKGDDVYPTTNYSRDGRYFTCEVHKVTAQIEDRLERLDAILLLDLTDGSVRTLPLTETDAGLTELHFSPAGDLLLRGSAFNQGLQIFDTATGAALESRAGYGIDASEEFRDDVLLHRIASDDPQIVTLEAWSWRERKRVGLINNAGPNCARSPDGRFYVAERMVDGVQAGKWGVWNLKTCRLESEFNSEDLLVKPRAISPDGRYLAASCANAKEFYIELRELPGGKQLATVRTHDVAALQFSPNGPFLVVDGMDEKPTRTMLEVPSLAVLWKRDIDLQCPVVFSRDGQTAFMRAPDRPEILCLDCGTGTARAAIPVATSPKMMLMGPAVLMNEPKLRPTPDRRRLLIHQGGQAVFNPPRAGWLAWLDWIPVFAAPLVQGNDNAIVIDTDTCRDLIHLREWNISEARLSDNGRILVTVHDEADGRVMRCWDLDGWKPLHWTLGVPFGLSSAIALVRWWHGRRGPRGG